MRFDHLSYAAGPDGLAATAERLSAQLGAPFVDGGFHPRFGTRNRVLPLTGGHYLEVVEVLDHPAADKMAFGQAVRERSLKGGGWLGWVVAVDDIAPIERRLERPARAGNRQLPDGTRLEWLQIGVNDLRSDPQLPFFIQWLSEPALHPSRAGGAGENGTGPKVQLLGLEVAGDPDRIDDWLGGRTDPVLSDVRIDWIDTDGTEPGIVAAHFDTPDGTVRI
ncbi:hypothetical protein FHX74_000336 [Friedmanniella endophytica]|uniref:Glyoxalase-like domain-containing protein n=1 Tax=Microlunatus kandeliicorticis TaxID=1759536 RepID=A0A7W3IPA9_9ACTN|nr:VOC family protein [Microlunatus kandeliicorticis]MBA8792742.1 hypothetical protein [Microlunatus kandeliicorticis]